MSDRGRNATAIIEFLDGKGNRRTWRVGCLVPPDDVKSMKAHLKRWLPSAVFLGVRFEVDEPPTAGLDPERVS